MNINNIASGLASDVVYPKPVSRVSEHDEANFHKEEASEHISSGGNKEDIDKLMARSIEQANKKLKASDRYIEREIHEKTHAVMYKLRDSITGEVIEEFPPKKFQDMLAKMWEIAGLFVDEKA